MRTTVVLESVTYWTTFFAVDNNLEMWSNHLVDSRVESHAMSPLHTSLLDAEQEANNPLNESKQMRDWRNYIVLRCLVHVVIS